jgi:hypothetical protein
MEGRVGGLLLDFKTSFGLDTLQASCVANMD